MYRRRHQKRIDREPTRRNALKIQVMGLTLLGSTGEKVNALIGDHWHWQHDSLAILCVSPGGKLPSATDTTRASFLRRKLVLQHCISISWKAKIVIRLRWADDGRVVVSLFKPGPWIDALFTAAASDPVIQ